MTCDGDMGGKQQSDAAGARCPPTLAGRCTKHQLANTDFEGHLVESSLGTLVKDTAIKLEPTLAGKTDEDIADWMRSGKTAFALTLAARIRAETDEKDVPQVYRDAINELKDLVKAGT